MLKLPTKGAPIFNEEAHTYTDPEKGFSYTSVTRWLERFKPVFEKEKCAERIAAKEGVTVEFILEHWHEEKVRSAEYGTKVHKALEHYNKTGDIIDRDCTKIIRGFSKIKPDLDPRNCFFEKMVYNKKLKIAGTADIIAVKPNKTFSIFDFKTNKKMRFQTTFNDAYLLKPIDHLPNTEYFQYALQLSLYAYIFEGMTGYEAGQLKLFWFNRENMEDYENYNGVWHIYTVPYLKEEIIKCIEYAT